MGNKSVLIVDDEEGIRSFLFDSLELHGYTVETVGSYESADKIISEKLFDIVIFDLKLGNRDSFSLIEKTKELHPNVRIIMMSAYGTIDIAVKALKYGASEFLEKPFSVDRLIEVIQSFDSKKEKIFVGNYILENKIGEGGTSIVYKAKHRSLLRDSAVKILKDTVSEDNSFRVRFGKEARLTASLFHRNIVGIYDYGKCKSGYYIAMEYVEGTSLSNLVNDGQIPLQVVIAICSVICRTLDYAHKKGIIHRDLKLENILIGDTGIKLVDFGLAKTYCEKNSSITHPNKIVGTPLYMSPEQVEGKNVTSRSDIFAVGIILYRILTGKYPFYNKNNMILMRLISVGKFKRPSVFNKAIDRKLERIIVKALNLKPKDRYKSAGEFADKLDEWLRYNGVNDNESIISKYYKLKEKGTSIKSREKIIRKVNNLHRMKDVVFPFLSMSRFFSNRKQSQN